MNSSFLRSRRVVVPALVVVGLVIASVVGLKLNQQNPAPRPAGGAPMVEAVQVKKIDLQDAVTAVGTLKGSESLVLRSELSGRIAAIAFKDGEQVRRGDLLIEFDAAIQRAQFNQARAERDLAAARLKRTQDLFDKKFLSAASLDDAKASADIAEAKLALAKATLEKMSIRAPFDGVVGLRQMSVGDYIREGMDLVNLEDVSRLRADFRIPEQFSSRLRPQQTVRLSSDAFPGKTFPAKVTAVDSAVDVSGRSLLVRAELTEAGQRLKPGMFVRVSLVLETRANALVVPEEALVTAQGRIVVFKVVDGKAIASPVKTGLRTMLDGKPVVEVVNGLTEGDTVVSAGQIKIRGNNIPVRIAGAEPPKQGEGPPKGNAAPKGAAESKGDAAPKVEAPAKGSPSPDASKKGP